MFDGNFYFSDKLIEKLKKYYKEKYGVILSNEVAERYLHSFAELFNVVTNNKG